MCVCVDLWSADLKASDTLLRQSEEMSPSLCRDRDVIDLEKKTTQQNKEQVAYCTEIMFHVFSQDTFVFTQLIFHWSTCLNIYIKTAFIITPTTLCQHGTHLDFLCYYLHQGKDGRSRVRLRDWLANCMISVTCKPKHTLSIFSYSHKYSYTTQRRNCHSLKWKLWHMVQNGNTQINHWFTNIYHISRSPKYLQQSKMGEMLQDLIQT